MPDQSLILGFQFIDRGNVPVGDNKDVRAGNRMNIPKSRDLLIAVDNSSEGFTGENLTENAGHKRLSATSHQRSGDCTILQKTYNGFIIQPEWNMIALLEEQHKIAMKRM